MSLARKPVTFRNLETGQTLDVVALIDSGSTLSALPKRDAQALGLRAVDRREFELAGSSVIAFDVADVHVTVAGRSGATQCVFGDEVPEPLLGVVTLETLQLGLDPLHEELIPVRGRMRGARAHAPS